MATEEFPSIKLRTGSFNLNDPDTQYLALQGEEVELMVIDQIVDGKLSWSESRNGYRKILISDLDLNAGDGPYEAARKLDSITNHRVISSGAMIALGR